MSKLEMVTSCILLNQWRRLLTNRSAADANSDVASISEGSEGPQW